MTGFGRFDLAYFRHTERWFTVYRGLTAQECLEGSEILWPVTRMRASGADGGEARKPQGNRREGPTPGPRDLRLG